MEKECPLRLHNGDRMMRHEFHRLYCQMPENYQAELIGGIVFEPSPVSYGHGTVHSRLAHLFETYAERTPGAEVADNATLILSDDDEVQPDLMLRLNDDHGGSSHKTKKGFIEGAPELVAEIAYSSRAIDLHLKKERYALAGVMEYMVVCLKPKKIYWFDLAKNKTLKTGKGGILRSKVFPGLWIHEAGLLELNGLETRRAIDQGLNTKAHQRFTKSLL